MLLLLKPLDLQALHLMLLYIRCYPLPLLCMFLLLMQLQFVLTVLELCSNCTCMVQFRQLLLLLLIHRLLHYMLHLFHCNQMLQLLLLLKLLDLQVLHLMLLYIRCYPLPLLCMFLLIMQLHFELTVQELYSNCRYKVQFHQLLL